MKNIILIFSCVLVRWMFFFILFYWSYFKKHAYEPKKYFGGNFLFRLILEQVCVCVCVQKVPIYMIHPASTHI